MVTETATSDKGGISAGEGHRGHSRPNAEQKKGLFLFLCFAAVVLVALVVGIVFERQSDQPLRSTATQNVGQLHRVEYNGQTHVEKTALTTLLLMGTDQTEASVRYGARQGGQADFLMLVVIDHNDRTIHQLQIDRDTIAEVETLGVLGNPVGTRSMQICLAHAFGSQPDQNCRSVVKAVENLLEGIEIDDYLSLSMNAIGTINHALGGVTVTLDEDLSYADPQMTAGATLQLSDSQAAILLHDRMQLGDGTNQSRMKRQRLYLTAAAETMRARMREDPEFTGRFLEQLEEFMVASIQRGELINEANRAYHYTVLPYETLEGEHTIGEDGFVEFHVAPGATAEWVMNTFYRVENK
ncbi:MAG: LCP family protein [Clostridia bacterium]|nr:LCP family protein [Clostridia bacterium]